MIESAYLVEQPAGSFLRQIQLVLYPTSQVARVHCETGSAIDKALQRPDAPQGHLDASEWVFYDFRLVR